MVDGPSAAGGCLMGLQLPRITVEDADTDTSRTVAVHCLREAAEHVEIGNMANAKTLTEAALIWLDGFA